MWFHTFGCKANQYDTERMRQELEVRGATTAPEPGGSTAAVINTCTVTNQADADARKLARRLHREHPGLRILVAGCSAALQEERYLAMPEVDGVVRGQDPVAVAKALCGLGVLAAAPDRRGDGLLHRSAHGTRAWLKIQDGCDRRCSFCATRLARGTSRSRPAARIVDEARLLARRHPELVLTGIHIGHYGRDLDPPLTLSTLCERLLEAVDVRFRLTSIEATEIDDRLLDLLRTADGLLAPHLHLPLQSGSDRILRLMRRWHTRENYRSRVLEIADRLPVLGLGADVIVGFPGEGEEEFDETRSLVEELPYTYLHVFPFSARDDTVAATLPDRVPGDVAARRSRQLRELALAKGHAHRAGRVGDLADVVLEGNGAVSGGLTGDYLRVEARGAGLEPGARVNARLLSEDGDSLYIAPSPGARGDA